MQMGRVGVHSADKISAYQENNANTINLQFNEENFKKLAMENLMKDRQEREYLKTILELEKKISKLNSQLLGETYNPYLVVAI